MEFNFEIPGKLMELYYMRIADVRIMNISLN
jgi:hypothetical protein